MHHRVEYFRSSDGTRIAGARSGSGAPLLVVPAMVDSIEATLARFTAAFPRHEILTYDRRGTGLSERDAPGESPDLFVADAQAVLDGFGIDEIAILGTLMGTVEATALAAVNPDRVTQLVLRSPILMAEWAEIPAVRAARAAMEEDWDYFVESFSQLVVGWGNPGGPEMAERFRAITTRDELRTIFDALIRLDIAAHYPRVRAKTLIEHQPDYFFPRDYPRRVAALIEGCRLEIFGGDRDKFVHDFSIALDFLEEGLSEPSPTGFQTILFTDLESSTAITQRLGDDAAQVSLERHDASVRAALAEHGGHEIKHTGDGIMARFGSAVAGVQAGLQISNDLTAREIGVRVGLNAGEPVVRDDDLFGTAVQLASRITDRAQPGQVLVSNVVQELCAGKRFNFQRLGEMNLKGFEQAMVVYEAREVQRPH